MSDSIFNQVRELFADFLAIEGDSIKVESTISDDLGVDSVDIVSIVTEIENAFDLKISDSDAAGLETVGQVVDLISAAKA
ncbi:hypothetical protein BEP19_16380 [Ammoniphilus oxalaticus]|uniref:Acyl carrier protein n=1 Tax=Ammoniphilus oxalaticus TaxID=66863 RepID=A0A419SQM4_9BACL|nr:acyl carrier protein [Ammoniphilus oxalaticus]RKD26776.1 hypothetical protein BEP19_16380 [Ammoniphilus oxalaticus]